MCDDLVWARYLTPNTILIDRRGIDCREGDLCLVPAEAVARCPQAFEVVEGKKEETPPPEPTPKPSRRKRSQA